MKSFYPILTVLVLSLFLTGCTSASSFYTVYDRGDCNTNRFDYVDNALDLRFQWDDGLLMRWSTYSDSDQFDGYYISRSVGDSCPYYTSSNYYQYERSRSSLRYTDNDVESGETYYYRLCVREKDREVACGSVARVYVR